jgi:hypothetical protein
MRIHRKETSNLKAGAFVNSKGTGPLGRSSVDTLNDTSLFIEVNRSWTSPRPRKPPS